MIYCEFVWLSNDPGFYIALDSFFCLVEGPVGGETKINRRCLTVILQDLIGPDGQARERVLPAPVGAMEVGLVL